LAFLRFGGHLKLKRLTGVNAKPGQTSPGLFIFQTGEKLMQKETEMVKSLYSGMVEHEWNRLVQDDFHRLEYDTTWRFLREYMPAKGLILDAGGGPGRYTVELARQGYDVVLLDLVAANLEWAGKEIGRAGVGERVKQVVEGTITDLSGFPDNSFDAVICLGGPLSHVCPESARRKAVSELVRVVKKGAPIFISVMSRYGVMLATPEGWPFAVTDSREDFICLFETGDEYAFVKDGYCHFFTSAELEELFRREKVTVLQKVGLEGFNTDEKTSNDFARNFPEQWQKWMEIHQKVCTDPFVVDASGHMMIIVRKA
jgi:SAM-dependent methyltransferase